VGKTADTPVRLGLLGRAELTAPPQNRRSCRLRACWWRYTHSAFALQATPVAISAIVGSQAEDTMPTGGDCLTTHMLAARFGQDYTGRVKASPLAGDALDWRSFPDNREVTR